MAWANAVFVFEKAKPARRLALDTSVRRARSRGSASKLGKVAIRVPAASTANASETGLALRFQIDSKACDKASSALTRVTLSGSVKVRAGSTKAISDHKASVWNESLVGVAAVRSHRVAQGVTSLPVPAVVGMEIKGKACAVGGVCPARKATKVSANVPDGGRLKRTLAESMVDPPPIATTTASE